LLTSPTRTKAETIVSPDDHSIIDDTSRPVVAIAQLPGMLELDIQDGVSSIDDELMRISDAYYNTTTIKEKRKNIQKEYRDIQGKLTKKMVQDYQGFVRIKKLSLKTLLGLIKTENKTNVIDFIELFPPTGIGGVSNTHSHVFEALWILVFLFNYDDLRGENQSRHFFEKLETMKRDITEIPERLEKTFVNSGNKGGIADIFFEHIDDSSIVQPIETTVTCEILEGEKNKTISLPSCENDFFKDKNKKFLCSAKYYLNEKSIGKYDIQDIFTEAVSKLGEFNIVLLVKNRQKIGDSKKALAGLWHKILDVTDLNIYYKKLKADLDRSSDVDEFIGMYSSRKDKTQLVPRFHQEYFINYSNKHIEDGNLKLIWGAVPRSGKSYMIAGLVARRQPKYVIIFMGAISETSNQFIEMFKKYANFNNYDIVNVQVDGYNKITDGSKSKKIVLISQQKGWVDSSSGKDADKKLLKILKDPDKLIFFDEIHQGSGTKVAQKKLLDRYVFTKKKLESPFIMVTATFAKPMLNYKYSGGMESKLIQWKYEDIQLMKEIHRPGVLDMMLDTIKNESADVSEGVLKERLLKEIIAEKATRGITLDHIANQYKKYPELVVMCPGLEETNTTYFEFSNVQGVQEKTVIDNDILCNTIFRCSNKEFTSENATKEFINYIHKKVYTPLKQRFGFDVFGRPHSQLWFLPTVCSTKKSPNVNKLKAEIKTLTDRGEDVSELIKKLERLEEGNKIEPISRLLAELLMTIPEFKKHFCVLVINSQKLPSQTLNVHTESAQERRGGQAVKYPGLTVETFVSDKRELIAELKKQIALKKKKTNRTSPEEEDIKVSEAKLKNLESESIACISTACVGNSGEGGVAQCIMKQEACAKAQGKGIIILTGMRLRLGISLPCVDIALHMDPIKSVDTIYQSMFRVLTERRGKDKGYFIDLLSERFIGFMYDYDDYTHMGKKNLDLKSKKRSIIDKLFTFNLNGMNQSRIMEKKSTMYRLYKSLLTKLSVDTDIAFSEKLAEKQTENIKKILNDIPPGISNDLFKKLDDINMTFKTKGRSKKQKKQKVSIDKRDCSPQEGVTGLIGTEECGEEELDTGEGTRDNPLTKKQMENEVKRRREMIAGYIKDIFSLYILFEEDITGSVLDTTCNASNFMEKFVDGMNYNITLAELKRVCDSNKHIIDCHIAHIRGLKLTEVDPTEQQYIVDKLNKYRQIIVNFISGLRNSDVTQWQRHKKEDAFNELLKLYCIIKDKFKLLGDDLNSGGIIYKPKCGPKIDEVPVVDEELVDDDSVGAEQTKKRDVEDYGSYDADAPDESATGGVVEYTEQFIDREHQDQETERSATTDSLIGGYLPYSKIYDPYTQRMMNINSNDGIHVLQKYLKNFI